MDRITFEDIRQNEEVKTYITRADETLIALGYTEHSYAHVTKVAHDAYNMLIRLGYDERVAELAKIAGYMHDIGNVINRIDHAQSGAVLAFTLLNKLGMEPKEISNVITAIGHHDEGTAQPVNAIAAAIILADKSDVRRTRVRNRDMSTFDIHDRVNYAVESSSLVLDTEAKTATLEIKIDTEMSAVMDYFEIFLGRMMLCRKAAEYLGLKFKICINGSKLL